MTPWSWASTSAPFLARFWRSVAGHKRCTTRSVLSVALEPRWAKARARVSAAQAGMGAHEEAVRAYAVALKLEPSNVDYARALAGSKARAAARPARVDHKAAGDAAVRTHRWEEAVNFYSAALRTRPRDAVLLSNRSVAHAGAGRFAEALADAQQASVERPNWARGWARAGFASFALRRFAQAAHAYHRAMQLEPGSQAHAASLEAALRAERAATEAASTSHFQEPPRYDADSPPVPPEGIATASCSSAGDAALNDIGATHDDIGAAAAALERAISAAVTRAAEAQACARSRLLALRWQVAAQGVLCARARARRAECCAAMAGALCAMRAEAAALCARMGAAEPQSEPHSEESGQAEESEESEEPPVYEQPPPAPAPKAPPERPGARVTLSALRSALNEGCPAGGSSSSEAPPQAPTPAPPATLDGDSSDADTDADENEDEDEDAWAARWEAEQWEGTSRASAAQSTPPRRRAVSGDAALPPSLLRRLFSAHEGGAADSLHADAGGTARGACLAPHCAASRCAAFTPFAPGSALPVQLPQATLLSMLSAPPRTRCAACGCAGEAHETRAQATARTRAEAERARRLASQLDTVQMQRRRRVDAAAQRASATAAAVARGCEEEALHRSCCDSISGAGRGGCTSCASCPGFEIWTWIWRFGFGRERP